jgi:hypothetical protein
MNIKQQGQILQRWKHYVHSTKAVRDSRGREIADIDAARREVIPSIRGFVADYREGSATLGQFKTTIASFNKRNNYWGFSAIKGQMFFNQLARAGQANEGILNEVLKVSIQMPADLGQTLERIDALDAYCLRFDIAGIDRRTIPNAKSIPYFLSYFWQIQDHEIWPIMYTSLIRAFENIGLWQEFDSQCDAYARFFSINEEIAELVAEEGAGKPSHWDIEHAFWDENSPPNKAQKPSAATPQPARPEKSTPACPATAKSIVLSDYLIPKIARLVELGMDTEKAGAKKGYEFEQMVAEVFRQLDFETEVLGQGSGRNPDVIARVREENTAFLVDAKAYSAGYSLGLDNRAIKEYINSHCPSLIKDGYKKIGFIIVSNSFKSDLAEFANEVTWNTDIKRFILIESEALLHLLAYKTRDRLKLGTIIESIVSLGNPITKEKIIEGFEDV